MKAPRIVVSCALGLLALTVGTTAPPAQAATVDLSILADNGIYSVTPHFDSNTGGWTNVSIGNYLPSIASTRGMFRFDIQDLQSVINGLNPGETLAYTGIALTLYQSNFDDGVGGFNGNSISTAVYQIRANDSDWVEGNAVGVVQNGSSDWNHKIHQTSPGVPTNWNGGVGLGSVNNGYLGYDSSPTTALATGTFSGKVDGTALVWTFGGTQADKTDLVTDWLANSNGANLLVRQVDEGLTGRILPYSREGAVGLKAGYAPKLTITYDIVTVPEPSTFAMLLFGSLVMWMVRRKRS